MSSARSNTLPKQSGQESKSRDLSVRIQKKLLSNKTVAKTLIDQESAFLLDNVHGFCRLYCKEKQHGNHYQINRKEKGYSPNEFADKIIKNIIKIIIKVAILIINEKFDEEELYRASQMRKLIRSIMLTIVSFHQVDFSYEPNYLLEQLQSLRDALKCLIKNHLTDKSINRVDFVFDFLCQPLFLDRFFTVNSTNDAVLFQLKCSIIDRINHLLDRENW